MAVTAEAAAAAATAAADSTDGGGSTDPAVVYFDFLPSQMAQRPCAHS